MLGCEIHSCKHSLFELTVLVARDLITNAQLAHKKKNVYSYSALFSLTSASSHNFVSSRTSCSKVSCKSLISAAAILTLSRSLPCTISPCLLKHSKFRACLNSGILNAYAIGLTKELEENMSEAKIMKNVEDMLRAAKTLKELKVTTDTIDRGFVKR